MKIHLDKSKGKLVLAFAYKKELVEAIKQLPDRHYNPETREWLIGFDESNLSSIIAMLAGNRWPNDVLDQAEKEAKEYLANNQPTENDQISEKEYQERIKSPLRMMGELVLAAYMDGRIDQRDQALMIEIINHLSLKDFITCKDCVKLWRANRVP